MSQTLQHPWPCDSSSPQKFNKGGLHFLPLCSQVLNKVLTFCPCLTYVHWLQIDATQESELGQRFGVQGYPTLKWFVDGEPTEYNGPRET